MQMPPFVYPSGEALRADKIVRMFSRFGAHITTQSLRVGGATHLLGVGIPLAEIMKEGRWKSDAVWRYLHSNVVTTEKISEAFGKSL